MADQHFGPSAGTDNGSELIQHLKAVENGIAGLIRHRDTMIQMRDGDGSDAAHYVTGTAEYGFVSNADARGFFLELDSALSKLDTDSSVSGVKAALAQLFARSR